MNKKVTGLFLTIPLVLTITTVLAVESNMFSNIEMFQNMALENSRQSTIDDLQIESKESALEDAVDDAKFLTPSRSRSQRYDNQIQSKVDPFRAEVDLEYAKREKEKNEEDLRRKVYKAGLDVLIQEKEIELESEKLDMLEEKYQMAETRHKEGKKTDNDFHDAQFAVSSKKIDLNKAEKNMEALNLELKRLLNVEMDDSPIDIEDQLVFNPMIGLDADIDMVILQNTDEAVDVNTVIEQAMEKSLEFYRASKDVKIQQMIMEISEDIFEEEHPTYKEDVLDLEIAKINLEDTKTNILVQVKNKYNDLITEEENVDLAMHWADVQKEKFEAEKLKFEKGIISREELLNAKEGYIEAIYDKYAAIHSYNVIKDEFEALYK
ncbi:TolC family protein [Herbivorax sp. ANBcel31]|uniref:TolC family protein n=1 Tax=Herbivorax sp. ANBcel31 TaxID=3069754 RepID=UPI0027AFF092|nr:TolC family protein [Herbivorax sp. ANBcel31]MDQ2086936.1 TolC family protein [Herbivorax sp. ANBcel31]